MKSSFLVSILSISVLAVGCVSQKKYNELQSRHSQLASQNQQCQSDLSSAKTRIGSLDDQLASERANLTSLQAALDKCLTASTQGGVNIAKLVDEINASNKYIQHLVNLKNKSDSLNMVLTNNLTRSLDRDELKEIDVKVLKGVVYISLSDNMLYKTGSYEISEVAGATLGKIAKVIKDYREYDVLVEGNTDDVPINRPNIRNNWDLSALRASSVVQALQTDYGVDPKRLTAGGRGEYNPVASNDTEAGKMRNRRTQIIVTPKLDQFMDLIEKAPENKD
ncbi:MAG: flagellar motor protein MotB [Flavipsychrobacter sp.]|jgi:chemotaxis protein MotB|nr:flagellar motor protein MotB [Flavipsychrobacter sp.]